MQTVKNQEKMVVVSTADPNHTRIFVNERERGGLPVAVIRQLQSDYLDKMVAGGTSMADSIRILAHNGDLDFGYFLGVGYPRDPTLCSDAEAIYFYLDVGISHKITRYMTTPMVTIVIYSSIDFEWMSASGYTPLINTLVGPGNPKYIASEKNSTGLARPFEVTIKTSTNKLYNALTCQ